MKNNRINKINQVNIEIAFAKRMQAVFAMYSAIVSVHYPFGYSFQAGSKDFIN